VLAVAHWGTSKAKRDLEAPLSLRGRLPETRAKLISLSRFGTLWKEPVARCRKGALARLEGQSLVMLQPHGCQRRPVIQCGMEYCTGEG
jgi:hypothetical protein